MATLGRPVTFLAATCGRRSQFTGPCTRSLRFLRTVTPVAIADEWLTFFNSCCSPPGEEPERSSHCAEQGYPAVPLTDTLHDVTSGSQSPTTAVLQPPWRGPRKSTCQAHAFRPVRPCAFGEQERTGCRQFRMPADVTKSVRECRSSQGHASRAAVIRLGYRLGEMDDDRISLLRSGVR